MPVVLYLLYARALNNISLGAPSVNVIVQRLYRYRTVYMQTMTAQKENNEVWFTGTRAVTLLFGFVAFTVAMILCNIKYAHVDTCECTPVQP